MKLQEVQTFGKSFLNILISLKMTTENSVVIFLILYLSHPANISMEDSEKVLKKRASKALYGLAASSLEWGDPLGTRNIAAERAHGWVLPLAALTAADMAHPHT